MILIEAIRALIDEFCIEDFVYNIRDRVRDDPEEWGDFDGNSWDHPKVKRYADACKVLEDYTKGFS